MGFIQEYQSKEGKRVNAGHTFSFFVKKRKEKNNDLLFSFHITILHQFLFSYHIKSQ